MWHDVARMKVKLTKEHVERALNTSVGYSCSCPIWQALKDAGFKKHRVNFSRVTTPSLDFHLSPNAQAITGLMRSAWSSIGPFEFEINPIETEETM